MLANNLDKIEQPKLPAKEIYWVNPDLYMEIETNEQALRLSLIEEAVRQGISEDRATNEAEKVQFRINGSEDLEPNWPTDAPGCVIINEQPTFCYINMHTAVNQVRDYMRFPEDTNNNEGELLISATREVLGRVWRHERQHLIDMMDPLKLKNMLFARKFTGATIDISLFPILLSGGYLIYATLSTTQRKEFQLISAASFVGFSLLTESVNHWWQFLSAHERSAINAGKKHNPNDQSPFTFNVYSFGSKDPKYSKDAMLNRRVTSIR